MLITSRRISILALTLALFLAAVYLLGFSSITRAQDTSPPNLATLRQEQIATLREAAGLAEKAFKSGTTTFAELDRLSRLLIDAELKAASSAQERITVLQDALDVAKKQEDWMSEKEKEGFLPRHISLEAKAYRLSIEVSLAEEQSAK